MVNRQLVVAGVVLVALFAGTGVVAAESHHKACPKDNPGKGLIASTDASEGTSLDNAGDGIGQAADSVGCNSALLLDDE